MQEEANKLYIGNLSFAVTDDQLLELFSALEGVDVVDAKVITDRESGRSRGFGFVTVATPEMAQKTIELMNNKEVDGRTIFVNIAKPQRQDNDRGGNRFGGRSFDRSGRR
ncbi:MAG: RNA-binding protein [Patescibacteria group bacterium]|jgi:RNA recognition motif-containing protein